MHGFKMHRWAFPASNSHCRRGLRVGFAEVDYSNGWGVGKRLEEYRYHAYRGFKEEV